METPPFVIKNNRGGRLQSISAIRLLAMLMIIVCHICQYFDNHMAWWFNVGVQIFFIISGFLYGSKLINSPVKWFLKNARKILLPYYLFLVPVIILYLFFSPEDINFGSIIRSLLCVGTIDGIGHLWFVGYILFCYFITPILCEITKYLEDKSFCDSLSFMFIFILLFYAFGTLTDFYFRADRVLCYITGFFVPLMIRKRGDVILKYILYLVVPATIISKVIYLYCCVTFPEISGLGHMEGISHLFLGISLTFGLMYLFKHVKKMKILSFSDKYSYSIYIVHQLFILSPFTLMTVTHNIGVNIVIVVLTITISGIILHAIATATNNFVSKYIKL